MKTKLAFLALLIAAVGMLTSCENGGGKVSSMQFKRMNIAGAKALALASDGSNQQLQMVVINRTHRRECLRH